jgi:hypothetical protein
MAAYLQLRESKHQRPFNFYSRRSKLTSSNSGELEEIFGVLPVSIVVIFCHGLPWMTMVVHGFKKKPLPVKLMKILTGKGV